MLSQMHDFVSELMEPAGKKVSSCYWVCRRVWRCSANQAAAIILIAKSAKLL
jgi:hypothetical protein